MSPHPWWSKHITGTPAARASRTTLPLVSRRLVKQNRSALSISATASVKDWRPRKCTRSERPSRWLSADQAACIGPSPSTSSCQAIPGRTRASARNNTGSAFRVCSSPLHSRRNGRALTPAAWQAIRSSKRDRSGVCTVCSPVSSKSWTSRRNARRKSARFVELAAMTKVARWAAERTRRFRRATRLATPRSASFTASLAGSARRKRMG